MAHILSCSYKFFFFNAYHPIIEIYRVVYIYIYDAPSYCAKPNTSRLVFPVSTTTQIILAAQIQGIHKFQTLILTLLNYFLRTSPFKQNCAKKADICQRYVGPSLKLTNSLTSFCLRQ
ncbi:hypothetical protein RND81_12G027100 [Saponaria officinalis]|uniref:Uncharacterized protein n=1 Tax=Saponaria officinalis TaxID=3572 RepID=A0AAW1H2G4_SAPOF